MAEPNLTEAVARAFEDVVPREPVDNTFDEFWFLDKLRESNSFTSRTGGRRIDETLEYAQNTTAGAYGEYDTIPNGPQNLFDAATYDWPGAQAVSITQTEIEDALVRGEAAKFDYMGAKMENARNSLLQVITNQLFALNVAAPEIQGIQSMISDTPTTGQFGGISAATWAFWRNQIADATQDTDPGDTIMSAFTSLYLACSRGQTQERPDLFVTTPAAWALLNSQLTPLQTFERMGNRSDRGRSGFTELVHMGVFVGWDNACPDSHGYLMRRKNFKLYYQSGYWMKAHAKRSPTNQLLSVVLIDSIIQTGTDNRRRLGVMTPIT